MDEQVGRTRLPNGIRVLTDRADFAQGVSIVAHVDVGSRDDPDESSGLAHVLEHMAFRATSKWDSVEMMALVEQTGGELNAYTTAESTAYEVYLPHEFLDLGVEILGDTGPVGYEITPLVERFAVASTTWNQCRNPTSAPFIGTDMWRPTSRSPLPGGLTLKR